MSWTKRQYRLAMQAKVTAYCCRVLDGARVVNRYVRLAVERHCHDLRHAEGRGYVFAWEIAADHCLWITANCQHSRGEFAGRPFILSENQAFIVWSLFGWRCADDGTRRFREAYITCGRKWGKSEFCSAVACKVTSEDEPREPGAVNLAVATKEDQARDLIFAQACRMVRRSPNLNARMKVFTKRLTTPDEPDAQQRGSSFAPVGSDSDTNDGHDSHVVFIDELHAWQTRHNGLWERMNTAGGSRRQPLTIVVTTAGDSKSYIWKRRDRFCCGVMEAFARGDHGTGDEHFAFIARLDREDDPFDEANWTKANPNYPITPKRRYLRGQANKAKDDPIERNTFLRFHGNVEVSSTEKAINETLWDAARGELGDWTTAVARGGGVDLGGMDDLCSVGWCAKFLDGETPDGEPIYRYEIRQKSWIDSEPMKSPHIEFVDRGELIIHPYPMVAAKTHMVGLFSTENIDQWAHDPHTATDLSQRIAEDHGFEPIKMPQTYQHFNEPIREFLKALKDGRVRHNGDTLLAWAAGNLHTKSNGREEHMPDKESSGGTGKIDPMVAILMAFRMAYFSSVTSSPMIF